MAFKKFTGKELFEYAWKKELEKQAKMSKAKQKWKEIQRKKRQGIKNPYDHFINNLPANLPKLTTLI